MAHRNLVAALALVIALGGVTALVVLGQDRPAYTTGSARAWQLFQEGEERLHAFQWALADSLLREAVSLDPAFAMAQATLAYNDALLGRRADLKSRITLADSLANGLADENERMLVQLRLCDVSKAWSGRRDSLLTLLEDRLPRHPLVIVGQATAAQMRGDTEAHEAAWRELLDIDPNYARAYNYLGYAAASRGRYEEAVSLLRRYAFLAPDLANPHDSLGEVLIWTGDYAAAEAELLESLRKQPDFIASVRNLITICIARGQLARAEELIGRTRAELAGSGMEFAFDDHVAGLWFRYGHLERAVAAVTALATAEATADRKPGRAVFLARLIDLADSGRAAAAQLLCDSLAAVERAEPYYEANAMVRRAIEADIHIYQALAYELLGEPTGAMAEWGRALVEYNREPPHARWWLHWRYGESLLKLGQPAEALVQADQVLGTNPNLMGVLLLRTRALLTLGRADEARATLARLETVMSQADADHPARAQADSLRRELQTQPLS
jgi:tetratricopeptide (TPR) repeat protein